MAKSVWALIAEIASILKVALATGETNLRASAIDDDKDVSIAWLLQTTNKEILKPKKINPFNRNANMSDIGKEFLEQYNKLMKSVQGKYQTLDELDAQNRLMGQIVLEGWSKIAGKNVRSLLDRPDATELLTHLPVEKIKDSYLRFANDSQKWGTWGLTDDNNEGWYSLSVDQYIPDAVAQVIRNIRGEKFGIRQEVEYEQDEYNRAKLQQQLDQAIESRAERLKKQERDDQKDALREEIKGINERADAEIKKLDEEQKTIQEQYKELMKPAALQAEAERLIMTQSQNQIISLIGEYAPEYDALGKTLGEKLLDGFRNKVGDVVSWFASLNNQLAAIQEQAAAAALSSADAFYAGQQNREQSASSPPTREATVVNQTVNFNEPVETASQAARRVAEANENLGALIYGSY